MERRCVFLESLPFRDRGWDVVKVFADEAVTRDIGHDRVHRALVGRPRLKIIKGTRKTIEEQSGFNQIADWAV